MMVMMVMMMVMMVIFIPEMRSITIFCLAKHVKKSSDSFGQPMKPFAQMGKACLLYTNFAGALLLSISGTWDKLIAFSWKIPSNHLIPHPSPWPKLKM